VSAAAIAAAACLAVVAAPDMLLRMQADVMTDTGEARVIALSDGSMLNLAPRSAVAIDVTKEQRTVRLLRGTAYFDIARDPAHPFRVKTGDVVTTVLGTAFEVRREADGAAVAVRRGLVAVACERDTTGVHLRIGDAVNAGCSHPIHRYKVQPSRIATWTQGRIVASDRPLREVVDALRPWHKGLIIAQGTRLDSERVTGVYDARHPARALRGLAAVHRLSVRTVTPWITIVQAD
ncbi:MAG: FecR domain-containing protein, partial [Novosphingobium sp.]